MNNNMNNMNNDENKTTTNAAINDIDNVFVLKSKAM